MQPLSRPVRVIFAGHPSGRGGLHMAIRHGLAVAIESRRPVICGKMGNTSAHALLKCPLEHERELA